MELTREQIVAMAVAIERNGRRISRRNPLLRAYSRAMAWAAYPRIRGRRALGRLLAPFRRLNADQQKGTRQ